jgi:hypothetical protein
LNRLDGNDQLAGGVGLEDQPFRPELDGSFHGLLRIVDGQEKNFGFGIVTEDLASCIQTIEVWHADVESDHVRF